MLSDRTSRPSVREVFFAFAKLGLTSFGGPIAHLGYFRDELVQKRKWVSEGRYAELVALCQILPGPASSQVGFALGLQRAGYAGALAAWIAFTLPSAILLVLFAWGAFALDGALGHGLLLGLKSVAVAVVAHAVLGMARTLTPDVRRMLIGIGALALALLLPGTAGQVSALLAGFLAGAILCHGMSSPQPESSSFGVSRRVAVGALVAAVTVFVGLAVLASVTQSLWAQVAAAFFRAGGLVFGGGHVLLPMLLGDQTVTTGVASDQLLSGYAAAQAVPGPLFSYAAFVGFELAPGAQGLLLALVALVAVFLPGMLVLLAALPLWSRLQAFPRAGAALLGGNAAVVGILAAALITPIITSSITGFPALGIAAGAFVLLQFTRLPAWTVVVLGAMAGTALVFLGAAA